MESEPQNDSGRMEIADLGKQSDLVLEQAAVLLVQEFDRPRGWPTLGLAREEVTRVLARASVTGLWTEARRLDGLVAYQSTPAAYGSYIRLSFDVSTGGEGSDAR